MLLSQIQRLIFAEFKANEANLVPLAYPQETFKKPSNGDPYAVIFIVPNETTDAWCGTLKTGNILINLSYPANSKLINPTIEAEKFLSIFSEGHKFGGVYIPDEGTIRNAVNDTEENGRYFIPIVIGFEAK